MKINGINPASTRKLKYGATAVILTAVVIAAVVIFNTIFSALVYKYNWYVDMTKEGIYGLSDPGRVLLDEIDAPINIRFCAPYDELENNWYTKMVLSLVKEMASEYDNITYDYGDIIKNPTAVAKYKATTATSIASPRASPGTRVAAIPLSLLVRLKTLCNRAVSSTLSRVPRRNTPSMGRKITPRMR